MINALMQNTLIGVLVVAVLGLALESIVNVAILKKKRIKIKASGWFHDFGFYIEADDNKS